ncbi:methyltransferase domain-containing protein [Pseudomonas sp. GD03842]|uniref:class I SAM-dependent methyltransferase n=1 Tax=Pseudomonas sp. GD03842 TaxID=2975385 RepID=UPI002446BFE9|nr:class I SAM-dependent methyltransferase [Pseudomonas sp. GD03842]MDH0749848.1 methyltransferase domain-containing protein [Pseudomonas sp. GD03842]
MSVVHNAAQVGFSTQAATYTQGRPDYPDELGHWLRHTLGIDDQRSVVDLGAGTGKFTRLLEPLTECLIAVEPVEAMRREFARGLPRIAVIDGTAQSLPLADGSVDALVCAQAFHWFADDTALAEIHRVLVPGGRLGLVWNVRDESVDWVAEITRIITPYEGDTPRFHTGQWRRPFQDSHCFGQPELTCFNYHHSGSAETVIMNRFLSVSFIAALPEAEKAEVTAQLRELIQTHPALRGREVVEFPYQTQAYLCRRLD